MEGHRTDGTDLDGMVATLERAVRRHPGEPWRFELLANAYESRASATNDLNVAARDLRIATRIRDELEEQGLTTTWEGENKSTSPCQNETVPYMEVEQVKTQPAVIVNPPDGVRPERPLPRHHFRSRLAMWALAATSPVLGWLLAGQPLHWANQVDRADVVVISLTPIAHAGAGNPAASEDDRTASETMLQKQAKE